MDLSRPSLAAGVAGPACFVAAWVAGGLLRDDGYSPVSDAISRLAEQGVPTAPLMTAGFIGFGVLVPLYARELGRALGSPGTRWAVTLSGLGTLAVAALPLTRDGGQPIDTWHGVAAGLAYAANVVGPVLAARHLQSPALRRASYALSGLIAACLVGSLALDDLTGLLQRAGLTLFDLWAVAGAVGLLRRAAAR